MVELEVYTSGLNDLDKILQLEHQLSGLRYNMDRNHNLVYFEHPRFNGANPAELRLKTKPQPLGA
jgi:hypothetical protein